MPCRKHLIRTVACIPETLTLDVKQSAASAIVLLMPNLDKNVRSNCHSAEEVPRIKTVSFVLVLCVHMYVDIDSNKPISIEDWLHSVPELAYHLL